MPQNWDSEADDKGTYIGAEHDPEENVFYYLLHGGDNWRPQWTY
jgi:hypothetical protein